MKQLTLYSIPSFFSSPLLSLTLPPPLSASISLFLSRVIFLPFHLTSQSYNQNAHRHIRLLLPAALHRLVRRRLDHHCLSGQSNRKSRPSQGMLRIMVNFAAFILMKQLLKDTKCVKKYTCSF